MPWPSSLVLLARDGGGDRAAPAGRRRDHPAAAPPGAAGEGARDARSARRGRLVVQPTVSWHRRRVRGARRAVRARGELLDEHLAAWRVLWAGDAGVLRGPPLRVRRGVPRAEAVPARAGRALWFGGQRDARAAPAPPRQLRRRVQPARRRRAPEDLQRLRGRDADAGRGMPSSRWSAARAGTFPDASSVADSTPRSRAIPAQLERRASRRSVSSRRSSPTIRARWARCAEPSSTASRRWRSSRGSGGSGLAGLEREGGDVDGQLPAVGHERGAVHDRGLVARQEQAARGDLLGRRRPAAAARAPSRGGRPPRG